MLFNGVIFIYILATSFIIFISCLFYFVNIKLKLQNLKDN